MKTTYFLLFSLLFLNANINAQSNEIGFSVLQFSAHKNAEVNTPNTEVNNLKNRYLQLTPVFTFNHVKANHIMYFVQYGFTNNSSLNKNTYETESSDISHSYSSNSSMQSQFLRLGIGKRNYWNSLEFTSSFYVPIGLYYHRIQNNESKDFNVDNNLIATRISNVRNPNSFNIGFYISQAVSYPILKNLNIGFDFNYGISQSIWNGTKRVNNVTIEDGNETSNSTTESKSKGMITSMSLFPTLFFKYTLPSKK